MPKRNFAAGEVLTALNVNTYLSGTKNFIINGGFDINQRGLTSTGTTASGSFGFDRWSPVNADGTVTYSAQTFTPGDLSIFGYEATNYARMVTSGQTAVTARASLNQRIEDVRTLAGNTVTVSFWAKAASGNPKVALELIQGFGTGGSPSTTVQTYGGQITLTTTWARYSLTVSIPAITGKTIGTNKDSYLEVYLWTSAGSNFNSRTGSLGIQNNTVDFWGVQVEEGSTATPFSRACSTIAGELAACQRYYYRITTGTSQRVYIPGQAWSTTKADLGFVFPTPMRRAPDTTLEQGGGINLLGATNTNAGAATLALYDTSIYGSGITATISSANLVAGNATLLYLINGGYIGFNAEL